MSPKLKANKKVTSTFSVRSETPSKPTDAVTNAPTEANATDDRIKSDSKECGISGVTKEDSNNFCGSGIPRLSTNFN